MDPCLWYDFTTKILPNMLPDDDELFHFDLCCASSTTSTSSRQCWYELNELINFMTNLAHVRIVIDGCIMSNSKFSFTPFDRRQLISPAVKEADDLFERKSSILKKEKQQSLTHHLILKKIITWNQLSLRILIFWRHFVSFISAGRKQTVLLQEFDACLLSSR